MSDWFVIRGDRRTMIRKNLWGHFIQYHRSAVKTNILFLKKLRVGFTPKLAKKF